MLDRSRPLFQDDAYLQQTEAVVQHVNDQGGIVLDQSIFYATSGGQPGDTGILELEDGHKINIATTVKDRNDGNIVLVPAEGELAALANPLISNQKIRCTLDWERRYNLMRMHTACHILSVICPLPITSANVGEQESRVDFDMPELPASKQELSQAMMEIVNGDHPVFSRWIEEAELDANPDLVKSKNVKPPRGVGKIRLVCIGEDSAIDSQPCGGTHVRSTLEVGDIHIGKIEKKGKENRRFRIRFGPSPEQ